jgi:hypothetical protein
MLRARSHSKLQPASCFLQLDLPLAHLQLPQLRPIPTSIPGDLS